jgi:two-component system, NarL family, sensor histidine kinase UhpB
VNPELRALTRRYVRALQGFLSGRGEAALQEAYDLGREALARGLGVHDLAMIQHRALLKALLAVATRQEGSRALRAAGKFLVEGMLPFEMSHRRSQEVNAALRDSEERYRSVVETARDVIFTLASDGKITSLNPIFESMTGWSRADWIGKDFALLVDPDDRERAGELRRAAVGGRAPGVLEVGIRASSGATIPSEIVATVLVRDERIAGVLGVARDITDRKLAAKALHHLNEGLEAEVKRIAHALHDEAGQLLASVHIGLVEIARDLPSHAARRLEDVRGLLDKIEEQLRHLSHELRPTILDDLGLRPALEFLADGVSVRTGLQIVVDGSPGTRLSSTTETVLYRIVQEALTNVLKPARGARARIELRYLPRSLEIEVVDEGGSGRRDVGDPVHEGRGLIGMHERAALFGGRLEAGPTPTGFRVAASLPIEPAAVTAG